MSLCKPLGAYQGGTRCSFLSIRAFLRDLGIKKRDNGGRPVIREVTLVPISF